MEYAYTTANISRRPAEEKAELIPNTFKEAMVLPVKVQWKAVETKKMVAAETKKMINLKNNNAYSPLANGRCPKRT